MTTEPITFNPYFTTPQENGLTPDYMQAESIRYGPDVFSLVKLLSGRFAVLDIHRNIVGYAETWADIERLGAIAAAQYQWTNPKGPPAAPVKGVTLGDLDL